MTKLQIIYEKNKKSSKIRNLLIKKLNQDKFKKENLIIVIGGDGFMLQTLKKIRIQKKNFMALIQETTVSWWINFLQKILLKT